MHHVPVVSLAPKKRSTPCSKFNIFRVTQTCAKHVTKYVSFGVGVVYSVPLSYGNLYVGQTGSCANQGMG